MLMKLPFLRLIKALVYVPPNRLREALEVIQKHLEDNAQVIQPFLIINILSTNEYL
jgi:hypothetical protein